MKRRFKRFYFIVASIFIYLLHFPASMARSASGNKMFFPPLSPASSSSVDSVKFISSAISAYDMLNLSLTGLSRQAYDYAKRGFEKLLEQGRVMNDSILSIIDFSQPSGNKRLYVLDLKNCQLLFNTFVAHGKNSGLAWANSFSNQFSSFKSCRGFFVTRQPYIGNNGYSLKLEGVEQGINDNAFQRAIVMHGASYVSESYIANRGFAGRSEGCPAIPVNTVGPIINSIKNETCLFIYHPDQSYIEHSLMLQ